MRILIDRDSKGHYRWRLVRRTPHGADVLARGVRGYPDERSCQDAAGLVGRASGEAMLIVQRSDGHWQWAISGPDGERLAESPAIFTDAAACGRALEDLRRASNGARTG